MNILCIEDSPSCTLLIEETLKRTFKTNLHIRCSSTLHEGVNMLLGFKPDVILLDLNLPDSKQEHTVDKIPRLSQHAAVVVLTGYDDQNLLIAAINAGAEDYLVKQSILGGENGYSADRDTYFLHSILMAHLRHRRRENV